MGSKYAPENVADYTWIIDAISLALDPRWAHSSVENILDVCMSCYECLTMDWIWYHLDRIFWYVSCHPRTHKWTIREQLKSPHRFRCKFFHSISTNWRTVLQLKFLNFSFPVIHICVDFSFFYSAHMIDIFLWLFFYLSDASWNNSEKQTWYSYSAAGKSSTPRKLIHILFRQTISH